MENTKFENFLEMSFTSGRVLPPLSQKLAFNTADQGRQSVYD